ncbi:uncharacterized protein DDB_G0271670, partial [Aplysia californica]|uniref:Uncharacterized protein DDB_G0271670 n=1 Tax=Aplysia californica TaxID=6500 RepID=A0ABM0KAT0_APLCA
PDALSTGMGNHTINGYEDALHPLSWADDTNHVTDSRGLFRGHFDLKSSPPSGHFDLKSSPPSGHFDLKSSPPSGHFDLKSSPPSGHFDLKSSPPSGHFDLKSSPPSGHFDLKSSGHFSRAASSSESINTIDCEDSVFSPDATGSADFFDFRLTTPQVTSGSPPGGGARLAEDGLGNSPFHPQSCSPSHSASSAEYTAGIPPPKTAPYFEKEGDLSANIPVAASSWDGSLTAPMMSQSLSVASADCVIKREVLEPLPVKYECQKSPVGPSFLSPTAASAAASPNHHHHHQHHQGQSNNTFPLYQDRMNGYTNGDLMQIGQGRSNNPPNASPSCLSSVTTPPSAFPLSAQGQGQGQGQCQGPAPYGGQGYPAPDYPATFGGGPYAGVPYTGSRPYRSFSSELNSPDLPLPEELSMDLDFSNITDTELDQYFNYGMDGNNNNSNINNNSSSTNSSNGGRHNNSEATPSTSSSSSPGSFGSSPSTSATTPPFCDISLVPASTTTSSPAASESAESTSGSSVSSSKHQSS